MAAALDALARRFQTMREFFWPSYRPERHYMRGPGPACHRRGGKLSGGDSA
ncbi:MULTISPECIES: hypothetical protein [unclassified Roseitalea]|uniref:hypothetical protein n=1 Tax=unclassified Roseitalea TaxID=2639107 RepID=UPI00273EB6B4|nr:MULTISPECIES: hypothetical protein [unclassified Roseitalea]